jgi:hypothetical protein
VGERLKRGEKIIVRRLFQKIGEARRRGGITDYVIT